MSTKSSLLTGLAILAATAVVVLLVKHAKENQQQPGPYEYLFI